MKGSGFAGLSPISHLYVGPAYLVGSCIRHVMYGHDVHGLLSVLWMDES